MSINDFIDKIKGHIRIDMTTLLCFCSILLVGITSFGLGRLSVVQTTDQNILNVKNDNLSIMNNKRDRTLVLINDKDVNVNIAEKKKMYIASKNGKLYYAPTCSGAKRILPKNEVWFASSTEAMQAGYTLSSSCK